MKNPKTTLTFSSLKEAYSDTVGVIVQASFQLRIRTWIRGQYPWWQYLSILRLVNNIGFNRFSSFSFGNIFRKKLLEEVEVEGKNKVLKEASW